MRYYSSRDGGRCPLCGTITTGVVEQFPDARWAQLRMCRKCFVDMVERLTELGELTDDQVHIDADELIEYQADHPMFDHCDWCKMTTPPQPVKHVCARCEEGTR